MLELNRQEWVDVGHSGGLGFCLLGVLLKEETRYLVMEVKLEGERMGERRTPKLVETSYTNAHIRIHNTQL